MPYRVRFTTKIWQVKVWFDGLLSAIELDFGKHLGLREDILANVLTRDCHGVCESDVEVIFSTTKKMLR
jgi:hypothetical protein